MDELVTGDAVVLELPEASAATRMVSAVVDGLVQVAVLVAELVVVLPLVLSDDTSLVGAITISSIALILVGLPTAVETLTRGRSLGRLVVGNRVVRDDGGPVRFRQALVRALTGVGELWLTGGAVALIASLANRRSKRLGDLLAGTVVVRERAARQETRPPVMPPQLEAWARSADVTSLPPGLALACRQLLARAERLHPSSRRRLGEQLLADLRTHVFPPPPPGASAERVVAAVLAERRRRDLARLRAQEERRRRDADELHRLPFSAT